MLLREDPTPIIPMPKAQPAKQLVLAVLSPRKDWL